MFCDLAAMPNDYVEFASIQIFLDILLPLLFS
jgi:hypothetical protein